MSYRILALTLGASLSAAVMLFSSLALAAGSSPSPTPKASTAAPQQDCSKLKKDSTKWKACIAAGGHAMNNEELYANGYKLAKAGDYQGALEFLTAGTDSKDVRFLTMIGYSTRKLGRIEEGMAFYAQALAIDPNSVNTREYLGEAYLQKKDLTNAKAQLVEIANRCGTTCEPYTELNDQIAKFQAGQL